MNDVLQKGWDRVQGGHGRGTATGYLISGRMRFIIADERHDVQPEIAGVSRAMWSTPQRPLRTRWGLRSSPL